MTLREELLFIEGPHARESQLQPKPALKKPKLEKADEVGLPVFSRDVPIGSRKRAAGETVVVKHAWKEQDTPSEIDSTKVDYVVFRQGEQLDDLSKINVRDGFDRMAWEHRGVAYFLRKTSEDVARALYNAALKIRGAVEAVVGYLRTMLGNFYVISAVERGSWAFDGKLAGNGDDSNNGRPAGVNLADVSKFDRGHRERLVELVLEGMVGLHKQRLVLGKFSLENLLLNSRGLVFTDLRKMRISRKSSLLVEEFASAMRYLFGCGIARRGDVVHAGMVYAIEMRDACDCWHRERNGKGPECEMDIVLSLEKEMGV